MDSDDDFGDFASVPAHVKNASLNSLPVAFSAPEMHSFAMNGLSADKQPATESNSDDDWGDFVEHSAPRDLDSPLAFDWFSANQPSSEHGPFKAFISDEANLSLPRYSDQRESLWIGSSELQVQHTQENSNNLRYDDFHGSWNPKGSGASFPHAPARVVSGANCNNEMPGIILSEQKIESEGRKYLQDNNPLPIPLSIFGDTELEEENSKLQLEDPATGSFQCPTVRDHLLLEDSKDFSKLIANLYTEGQPLSNVEKPNTFLYPEPAKSMGMSTDLSRHQSIAVYGSCELEKRILMLDLGSEHALNTGSLKSDVCSTAGVELQSCQSTTSSVLNSVSETDQRCFVEAWSSMMAVCASELELALEIWKQAQIAGVHLTLLADLQGKRYFAAIGQVYVVALILGATLNVYKPWLQVATNRGESLRADLERCRAVWLETNLKEGICIALDGLEGWSPASVLSWHSIQQFGSVVLEAYMQAARASVPSLCKICLLPMHPFSCAGLYSIEWSESKYLLPLANLWANCISQQPPLTSLSTQPRSRTADPLQIKAT